MAIKERPQPDSPPLLTHCPRCGVLIVGGASGPVKYRLSRFSVPLSEARVLIKYGHMVYNLWRKEATSGWLATDWWGGPYSKGRLYTAHDCYARK